MILSQTIFFKYPISQKSDISTNNVRFFDKTVYKRSLPLTYSCKVTLENPKGPESTQLHNRKQLQLS